MLSELIIRDFAIIDDLRLLIPSGFTVLTGETGAGKSIILDAVMLLLGGRADSTLIRAGRDLAYLEGAFTLTPPVYAKLQPVLEPEGLDDGPELVLARELRISGRNICRINGRTVTLALLDEVGQHLVDIHGQGEHLTLLRPSAHLPLLDDYARLTAEREALSAQVSELRKRQQELERMRREARNVAQRIDILTFQVQEIQAAKLQPHEEEELRTERTRLANAEKLTALAREATNLLLGVESDAPTVSDLLNQAEKALVQLGRLDESQQGWAERVQGLLSEFDELSKEIRDYGDLLEFNPGQLDYLEERIELINRLRRKYGADIPAILAHQAQAEQELDAISHSDERVKEVTAECEKRLRQISGAALQLSAKRKKGAEQLATAVERELEELQIAGARFSVAFRYMPQEGGAYVGDERLAYDQTGIDRLEFMISTNPGEPLKPLAKVASGGETARLMLALKATLAQVDATPTLIFDEIDQGIGGRVGDIVGRKLWGLTDGTGHQVIVVTHLPQLAGYGDCHFHVSKHLEQGRTLTRVAELTGLGRIAELGAMLGTQEHAQEGAEAILRQATATKNRALADP